MGCAGRNLKLQAVAIIFKKESQILSREMAGEKLFDFSQMQMPVALTNRSSACLVVVQLYDKIIQIQKR